MLLCVVRVAGWGVERGCVGVGVFVRVSVCEALMDG